MDRKHWARLRNADGDRVTLEPTNTEILPLSGEKFPVIGIARGVLWKLKEGFRTYSSDFYITYMDEFDVLFSRETMMSCGLLTLGKS
jgi:hypothetical protein